MGRGQGRPDPARLRAGSGEISYNVEKDGDLPEEDDDNAYQNSDEALPDDQEESAIKRHPTREGRFDET